MVFTSVPVVCILSCKAPLKTESGNAKLNFKVLGFLVSVGVSIGGRSDELLVFVKNNEIGMGQLSNQAVMLNGIPLNEYSLL